MDSYRRLGLVLACLTLLLCLGAAAPKISQTPEDLVGSWKLNEDLSQDPRAMRPGGGDRGPRGGGRPPGGGPRGGGRSGPRPGGGSGGGEGFQRPQLPPGQIVAMAGGATSLRIETEGPQLTVTYGGDNLQHLLFTDGRKIRKEQEGSEEMVQRTRWRDEHLEIETTAGSVKVTELWVLTNDRKRIFATVEMDLPGGRRKASFRRVWDRVEGEKGEASPAATQGAGGPVSSGASSTTHPLSGVSRTL